LEIEVKNVNPVTLYYSGTDASSQNMKNIPGQQVFGLSFIVTFSDAASGTLQIQASNDPPNNIVAADFSPVNWVNVPGSVATATVAAGGTSVVYTPVNFFAQNYRLVWTVGAGSGTMNVYLNAVG
jgi:hypothetical protein